MSFSIHGRFREQVRFLRRQFLQDGELPFTEALSESAVAQALKAFDAIWLDRIYSPLVTLWVFLGQVLSQDHSCRAAVARLIAHRVSRGEEVTATGRCVRPGSSPHCVSKVPSTTACSWRGSSSDWPPHSTRATSW
jgi:hypothetical protein